MKFEVDLTDAQVKAVDAFVKAYRKWIDEDPEIPVGLDKSLAAMVDEMNTNDIETAIFRIGRALPTIYENGTLAWVGEGENDSAPMLCRHYNGQWLPITMNGYGMTDKVPGLNVESSNVDVIGKMQGRGYFRKVEDDTEEEW